MTQLLASYYVEATNYLNDPVGLPAGDVRIERSPNNGNTWVPDSLSRPANNSTTTATNFWTEIIQRSYQSGGQTRYYYKIDVYRGATTRDSTTYRLIEPGIYERRLAVEHKDNGGNTITLARKIYLTIQPDIEVYRTVNDQAVPLITTAKATPSTNPLQILKTITVENTSDALAARKVLMNNVNKHKASVFVKTNVSFDAYCNDFTHDTAPALFGTTWLRLQEKILMKRLIGTSESKWTNTTSNQAIKTDLVGNKYVENAVPANAATYTLGFEKLPLILPLHVSSNLELRFAVGKKFTENGNGADENYQAVALPLSTVLKTTHACIVTPPVVTLDEDNNYSSFVSVETNDGINWTFPSVDPRLTVSATSGTGRTGVVVKKAADIADNGTFDWNGKDFHNIALTAQSVVAPLAYPDIDGNYTESGSADVHVERYAHTRNALIPKQAQAGSFDHTLTNHSQETGTIGTFTVHNIDSFPSIEHQFVNGAAHRVRSWSMQSVGTLSGRQATRLILSGKTPGGTWIILDDTSATLTNTTSKPRVDRIVKNTKLVNAIRVTAIAATAGTGNVRFPQIQVFAGEWVIPRITANNTPNDPSKVTVYPDDISRVRVFDRNVSGNIAHVGSSRWYFGLGAINNDVAHEGIIRKFTNQSLGYLAVSFLSHRLIGYLYSIDELSGNYKNLPYAASLYFEGRAVADAGVVAQDSDVGGWTEIGIISLDKCIGKCFDPKPNLQTEQAKLDQWADDVLGLTGSDKDEAFIVYQDSNENRTVIQYTDNEWQDKETDYPEVIQNVANRTHYADFAVEQTWAQLRFTAKSIMNTTELPYADDYNIAMPEIQFFGMPTGKINTGAVANVAYLKAEDTSGDLHDMLGRNQILPHQRYDGSRTYFRFYIGGVQNLAVNPRLYLLLQNTSGAMTTPTTGTPTNTANSNHKAISNVEYMDLSESGNFQTSTYYEVYTYSSSNEKIILSSGYTGVPS